MATGARRATDPAPPAPAPAPPAPAPKPVDEKAALFQWCENQQARIVWGEYLSGRKFCRVRVGRQLEREGPDFVSACLDAKAAHERATRSNPMLRPEE